MPGLVGPDGVERLAVLGHVDAVDEDAHHPALVGVEDELLVADGQPALEPAGGVEHEVDARRARSAGAWRRSRRRPARRRSSSRTASRPSGTARRGGAPARPSRRARAPAPGSRTSARPTASTSTRRTSRARPARPGRMSWTKVIPASASARVWAQHAGRGDRGHRAGQDERREDASPGWPRRRRGRRRASPSPRRAASWR